MMFITMNEIQPFQVVLTNIDLLSVACVSSAVGGRLAVARSESRVPEGTMVVD